MVQSHLDELDWNQQRLADETQETKSQICNWLSGRPNPRRQQINKIALAIARGYDSKRRNDSGSCELDILLNELLIAGGHPAITGASDNEIWRRLAGRALADRTLTVGWVNYPYFSEKHGDVPSGLAVEIMQQIALFMGCQIQWIPCRWSTIVGRVEKREIDMACPILLELPTRMFHVKFSDPLPDIRIPLNGVVHRDFYALATDRLKSSQNASKLALCYISGEAGEDLCTMFAHKIMANGISNEFRPLSEGADFLNEVVRKPYTSDKKIKCLVADHTICARLVREHEGQLALLYPNPADAPIQMPIAAAVHRNEPDLLNLVNSCLSVLTDTGYFQSLYSRSKEAEQLRLLGALSVNRMRDKREGQIMHTYFTSQHRSPGLPSGKLREPGTIHMHVDGGGQPKFVLEIVKSLQKQDRKGKLSVIIESVAGPQRQDHPELYESHTPGMDGKESLEYFSTTGLLDRADAIKQIQSLLPQLQGHPGAVVEVECVFAEIDKAGRWKQSKVVPPISDKDVGFIKGFTFPFEIHHAFNVPVTAGEPLKLEELVDDVTRLGIRVGGWFIFLNDKKEWSYRSNAFVKEERLRDFVTTEYEKIARYLAQRQIQAEQWTIVEQVLGIWKAPVQPWIQVANTLF